MTVDLYIVYKEYRAKVYTTTSPISFIVLLYNILCFGRYECSGSKYFSYFFREEAVAHQLVSQQTGKIIK